MMETLYTPFHSQSVANYHLYYQFAVICFLPYVIITQNKLAILID